MPFVRFVVLHSDPDSGKRQGFFFALADLEDAGVLQPDELTVFNEAYQWFRTHLRRPRRLRRSGRPHAKNVALSWFKDSATEHIRRMRDLGAILEAHGIHTIMITTERPGYIVYEDPNQVAAEPFNDSGA